ncbi:MAG: hypothetical protein BWY79_00581 [Actinobacteria bacterium ADurb.Bin444]|nr:MAG: hypothetical protein BWY79_00581 [Actinobacteria bacterium ADurb.Bin444]
MNRLRAWLFALVAVVALVASCDGTVTPGPTPEPTPNCQGTLAPLATRVADMEATVVVWETVMPDVMQTCAQAYDSWAALSTAVAQATPCGSAACPPTPTPTPALCQRCLTSADCPDGYTCRVCATCYQLCVRLSSPNGDCTNCLNGGPIK